MYLVDKMATKKTISNTTLNKWNEDDEKIWRVVERQIKLEKIDIDSWTAAVDQIGVKIKISSFLLAGSRQQLRKTFKVTEGANCHTVCSAANLSKYVHTYLHLFRNSNFSFRINSSGFLNFFNKCTLSSNFTFISPMLLLICDIDQKNVNEEICL